MPLAFCLLLVKFRVQLARYTVDMPWALAIMYILLHKKMHSEPVNYKIKAACLNILLHFVSTNFVCAASE
jgi:hypothetical protein